MLLLQQIRPAIQVTRSDVYKETWRHSQTGFFLFFGGFFCGDVVLRRSVDISSCDCGDQKWLYFTSSPFVIMATKTGILSQAVKCSQP